MQDDAIFVRKESRQARRFPSQNKYFAHVGEPDRSSANFPLVEVPASKETLKYGGFLQRNCTVCGSHSFPSGNGNGYAHYTSSFIPISNELKLVDFFFF